MMVGMDFMNSIFVGEIIKYYEENKILIDLQCSYSNRKIIIYRCIFLNKLILSYSCLNVLEQPKLKSRVSMSFSQQPPILSILHVNDA